MDIEREAAITARYAAIAEHADERTLRRWAGAEANTFGHGGVSAVARATSMSRNTVADGVAELEGRVDGAPPERVRRKGGGRKRAVTEDKTLLHDLDAIVEPTAQGDPMSPLRWTCKSVRKLAAELNDMGHKTSPMSVSRMLFDLGYSLQVNKKTLEGTSDHPDRNDQFEHINAKAKDFQASGDPIISVDTKKKELVGEFKNNGQEIPPVGDPEQVNVHDFVGDLGRAAPYGIYDPTHNDGWVSVGTDHDTSEFAVESIRRWWHMMGVHHYANAARLFITADGGGSNASRARLWKLELQKFADELGIPISVSHLPPGTSKWNKIEHRMFSFISMNWRGKPLVNHETIVNLIAATTTSKGLRIQAEVDHKRYVTGIKVSKDEMASLRVLRDEFHPEWNYTLQPRSV